LTLVSGTDDEARRRSAGRARELLVSRVNRETSDASTIALRVPPEESQLLEYRPGQFLTVRVPSGRAGSVARCYSLASSPYEDDELLVTVKRTAGGYASNWLCDNVAAGATLTVLPASGQFTPASLDADLLLFAGGSGITPIFSIARSVMAKGSGRMALFYANRDESSVIFATALRELAAAHPDRLEIVHWLESLQGLPAPAALERFARAHAGWEAFLCGPEPFMAAVDGALARVGLSRASIHKEVFTSLSGDPFSDAPDVNVIEDDADAVPASVDLEGATHQFRWPRTVTLVELLLSQGLEPPYMCRDGECGACQATVESGDVRMINNSVLAADDLADGYILTCQAVPDGDEPIRIRY
jgi:3-ketosteroid 9alpha-monooxygenase subunit B